MKKKVPTFVVAIIFVNASMHRIQGDQVSFGSPFNLDQNPILDLKPFLNQNEFGSKNYFEIESIFGEF